MIFALLETLALPNFGYNLYLQHNLIHVLVDVMDRNYDLITKTIISYITKLLFQNNFTLRKTEVTNFAEIVKIQLYLLR